MTEAPKTDRDVLYELYDAMLLEAQSWAKTLRVGDWIDSDRTHVDWSSHVRRRKNEIYKVSHTRTGPFGWRGQEKFIAYCRGERCPNSSGFFEFSTSCSRIIVRDGVAIWESARHEYLRYLLEHRFDPTFSWVTRTRWERAARFVCVPRNIKFPPAVHPDEKHKKEVG